MHGPSSYVGVSELREYVDSNYEALRALLDDAEKAGISTHAVVDIFAQILETADVRYRVRDMLVNAISSGERYLLENAITKAKKEFAVQGVSFCQEEMQNAGLQLDLLVKEEACLVQMQGALTGTCQYITRNELEAGQVKTDALDSAIDSAEDFGVCFCF